MATTLFAKKANGETPIATDDDHHDVLTNDPAVSSFPTGGGFGGGGFGSVGDVTASTAPAASAGFGAPVNNNNNQGAAMPNANNVQITQNQAESLKSGGGAMSEGGESTVALDKDATDWINKKMRPMMGWIYMLTCTADFVIFPVLWSVLQALSHGQVTSQWQPLTLQGAGLYHIAMGAVLGIAAYGRTKEKVAGVA